MSGLPVVNAVLILGLYAFTHRGSSDFPLQDSFFRLEVVIKFFHQSIYIVRLIIIL